MKLIQLFESKFPTSREEVEAILNSDVFRITGSTTINDDLTVSVDGHVTLLKNMTQLPVKFRLVTKSFTALHKGLATLEGAPKEVGGNFVVNFNELHSLKGAPKEVGGSFYCTGNKFETLLYSPNFVGEHYDCGNNRNLKSSVGVSKHIGGDFYCYKTRIKEDELMQDLDYVGGNIVGDWSE